MRVKGRVGHEGKGRVRSLTFFSPCPEIIHHTLTLILDPYPFNQSI
jgi:hypothetical protein